MVIGSIGFHKPIWLHQNSAVLFPDLCFSRMFTRTLSGTCGLCCFPLYQCGTTPESWPPGESLSCPLRQSSGREILFRWGDLITLPGQYEFQGKMHGTSVLLTETDTVGLLVLKDNQLRFEHYYLDATDTNAGLCTVTKANIRRSVSTTSSFM